MDETSGPWWALLIGLVGGFLLCAVTLVPYVWHTRWQEGFQRGLEGWSKINWRYKR